MNNARFCKIFKNNVIVIDLNQLRQENYLEDEKLTDFSVASDGTVYLLMEQPSGKQSKDWLRTPSAYTVVERDGIFNI